MDKLQSILILMVVLVLLTLAVASKMALADFKERDLLLMT
jgi:hypothetical protein